jgi:hypothetical protein
MNKSGGWSIAILLLCGSALGAPQSPVSSAQKPEVSAQKKDQPATATAERRQTPKGEQSPAPVHATIWRDLVFDHETKPGEPGPPDVVGPVVLPPVDQDLAG